MGTLEQVTKAVNEIKTRAPDMKPKVGIILGSGLGGLADEIENPIAIPYGEIPGFSVGHVKGHAYELILGKISGAPVACLKGRIHIYEDLGADKIRLLIRTLKMLGCETLIMSAATGGLIPDAGPGSLVLVKDHINLQIKNPLMGPNDDEFGPRFQDMTDAYDPDLREKMEAVANDLNIKLIEGVYGAITGPTYETAAEIRAYRVWGVDVAGMSVVPETIIARHCGMKVLAIAIITNFATGLATEKHDHNKVVEESQKASAKVVELVSAFLKKYMR